MFDLSGLGTLAAGLSMNTPAGMGPVGAPAPPMAAPPQMAMPEPSGPMRGTETNHDTRDMLMQLAPMVMSMFVAKKNPMHAAAIMRGMSQGNEAAQAQQLDAMKREQTRKETAARFMQDVAADAQQFDDPIEFQKYLQFAEKVGEAVGVQPGSLSRTIAFPASKAAKAAQGKAAARVKELQALYGEKLSDPEVQNFTVDFDGKRLKVSDLMGLAGLQIRKADGSSADDFLTPKGLKEPTAPAGTETERAARLLQGIRDAEARGDTGTASALKASYADLLKAKKDVGMADDRPTDPTLQAIRELTLATARDRRNAPQPNYTPAQDRAVNQLADDFARDSKDFIVRAQSFDTVKGAAKDPTAAGDLSLIFAYMKMLDPGSVVREGEFATAQNSTGVPDRVRNLYNKIISGNRLNPAQRADFVNQAKNIYATSKTRHDRIKQTYTDRASRRGINPADVIMDYGSADEQATAPAAGEKPATLKFNPATGRVEKK